MQKIMPIIIACGERYVKLATIAISSFLQFHKEDICLVTDNKDNELSSLKKENLKIFESKKYEDIAKKEINIKDFQKFNYDGINDHDRIYSSLKPLIMDKIISEFYPDTEYILSLDADTLFTGNILELTEKYLKGNIDLYMVERKDKRMLKTGGKQPGSGFTLWKRNSKFIDLFKKRFKKQYANFSGGGSQILINNLRREMPSTLIDDPKLHFVSPDLNNPKLTDDMIKSWDLVPAYIHLHGKNSYNRLLRFKKVLNIQ